MHWWTDWCCQWGWNCKQIDSKWNSWRRSIHSSDKCNRLLPDICSKCLALFCLVWPARATFCDIIYFLNTMSNIISAAILVHSGNQIISICSNLYVAKGLEAAARSQHRTETSRQQMWHLLSRTQHLIRGLRWMDRISSAIRHQVLFFCPLYSGLSLVLFSQALVQCAYMPFTHVSTQRHKP